MSYIYLLKDKNNNCYVGKTNNIKRRLKQHKNNSHCCSRKLEINFEYEILEEYGNEYDLAIGEQYWYDIYREKYGDLLVNKCRPNTLKEYGQKYYRQKYYEQNKEKMNECSRQYNKQLSINKKEQIKKRECECGGIYSLLSKERHLETPKHQEFILGKNN